MSARAPGAGAARRRIAWLVVAALALPAGCNKSPERKPEARSAATPGVTPAEPVGADPDSAAQPGARPQRDRFAGRREAMVENDIAGRGIDDPAVLAAMRAVPRHEFVPDDMRWRAYHDRPLPIGDGQTISQPYIVALMTQLAQVSSRSRVLEIGTGSGYQAAVLAEIAREVYTIEIIEALGLRARAALERLGYRNLHYRIGDGYGGWPEAQPFDAVIVTAAPPRVPEPLKNQLAVGGKLVIPVGEGYQMLRVITRTESGFEEVGVASVLFVPMTGEAQR